MIPAPLLRLAPYAAAVLATAAVLAGTYWLGGRAERADWLAREAEIRREVAEVRLGDERRVGQLAVEVERLRARPERIRTVTREVIRRVKADAQCPSLPADWGVLWSAGADPAPAAPAGVADAAPARVAEPARVALGDAAEAVAEARARFATCVGQLSGLQAYVRDVVRPE